MIQSPRLTCGFHFQRKAKNVPRTYQLFPISWSWSKNIHWMFLLLHKAVEDFFNHVPFII